MRKAFNLGINLKLEDVFISRRNGIEKFNVTLKVPESCYLTLGASGENVKPLVLQQVTIPRGTSTVCFNYRYLRDKYGKLYLVTADIFEVTRREWQMQMPANLPRHAPPKVAYQTYPLGVDASTIVISNTRDENVMVSMTKYIIDHSPPGFLVRTSAFRIEGDRLHAVYVDDMDSRRKITDDADVNASSWKSPRITITK